VPQSFLMLHRNSLGEPSFESGLIGDDLGATEPMPNPNREETVPSCDLDGHNLVSMAMARIRFVV